MGHLRHGARGSEMIWVIPERAAGCHGLSIHPTPPCREKDGARRLEIVVGAPHLFAKPGALDEVVSLAGAGSRAHLVLATEV
ncbi:MAG: hypothetical protein RIC93_05790 [Alphaproteobacteria bacterium]